MYIFGTKRNSAFFCVSLLDILDKKYISTEETWFFYLSIYTRYIHFFLQGYIFSVNDIIKQLTNSEPKSSKSINNLYCTDIN